jgi:hypothetical protein
MIKENADKYISCCADYDSDEWRKRAPNFDKPQLSESNKHLVFGPKCFFDTKTDWPPVLRWLRLEIQRTRTNQSMRVNDREMEDADWWYRGLNLVIRTKRVVDQVVCTEFTLHTYLSYPQTARHRTHRFQQYIYCCVRIRCYGRLFIWAIWALLHNCRQRLSAQPVRHIPSSYPWYEPDTDVLKVLSSESSINVGQHHRSRDMFL